MKPNKDKRHFITKHLRWGDWVFFPNDNHFSFHIENELGKGEKYYISNPKYKQYKTPCIRYPDILILKQGVKYCEVDENTFYHLLWAMLRYHKWMTMRNVKNHDWAWYVPIRDSTQIERQDNENEYC